MSDFETAVNDSRKLTSKPSNEELLDLYGTPAQLRTNIRRTYIADELN